MSRPQGGPLPSLSEFTMMTAGPPQPRMLHSERDDIGRPVTFRDGQFKGRTLRAELIELQKADLGRKYARKDRRPLDPPPVVQLKLFEVTNVGMPFEESKEFESYDDMGGFGILCHVDLFEVPPQHDQSEDKPPSKRRRRSKSRARPMGAAFSTRSRGASTSTTPTPSATSPSFAYNQASPSSYLSPHSSTSPGGYGHASPSSSTYPSPPSAYPSSSAYPPPSAYPSSSTYPPSAYPMNTYTIPPPGPPPGTVTLPPISSLDPPQAPGHYGSGVQLPSMQRAFGRPDLTLPPLPPGPPPPHPHYPGYQAQQPQPQPQPGPSHQYPAPQPPPPTTAPGLDARPIRAGPDAPEGVVAYLNGFEIREDAKVTDALAGASFAQSQSLEYHGRKVLMFVFSDIAVRNEGTFILRYRVFNIFGKAANTADIPILAECYGGPFRIFSTKEFPGLRPSTDLTKHLSYFGVRLNLRETERRRRRAGEMGSPGPSDSARGRRRRRKRGDIETEDSSDDDDDDDD